MTTEIVVDPEVLRDLADSLRLAHNALDAAPRYAHLEAGDTAGHVPEAVEEFSSRNTTPREDILRSLDGARRAIDSAATSFTDAESSLVRALSGGERR